LSAVHGRSPVLRLVIRPGMPPGSGTLSLLLGNWICGGEGFLRNNHGLHLQIKDERYFSMTGKDPIRISTITIQSHSQLPPNDKKYSQ
jgi:hypothetical protein